MVTYLQKTVGVAAGDVLLNQKYRNFKADDPTEDILQIREEFKDDQPRMKLKEKLRLTDYEEQRKECSTRRLKYLESLPHIHAELKACATDGVIQLWQRSKEFDDAFNHAVEDPIRLVSVILETCVNSANRVEDDEDIRNDTVKEFYNMQQMSSENTMQFKTRIESQAELVASYGGFGTTTDADTGEVVNIQATDRAMANILFQGLNLAVKRNAIYVEEMQRQITFNTGKRPQTMEEIISALSQIHNPKGFERTVEGHANFSIRGGRGRGNSGRSGRGGRGRGSPAGKLHKNQCRICHEFGHWGNECTKITENDKKDAEEEKEKEKEKEVSKVGGGGKSSRMIRISRPGEDQDEGDIAFYHNAMIRVLSGSTCNAISKMTPEEEVIGFDTMSNVTIFTNRHYVENVRLLKEAIEVTTMGGMYELKYIATSILDGKEVYFAPGAGINILAAHQYRRQRRLEGPDNHDVVMLEGGIDLHFRWLDQLELAHLEPIVIKIMDLRAAQHVSYATVLRERQLNRREIEAAAKAREVKQRCMNRTSEEIIRAINNGVIYGFEISAQDLMNDLKLKR